ncbi:MAG: hypothetical protein R3F53_19295 [Gammaproteobacteria bacterium]
MEEYGLSPNLPQNYEKKKLVTLYDSDQNMQGNAKFWLRRAAHAALLLNLNRKNTPKGFPDYETREKIFIKLLSLKYHRNGLTKSHTVMGDEC